MEREVKEINIDDVVKYLSRAFSKAASKAAGSIGNRAHRIEKKNGTWGSTPMYEYQVDFCYMIDNIQRAPKYVSKKNIHLANDLIGRLEAESS